MDYHKVEKEFIKSCHRKDISECRINRYIFTFGEMKNLKIDLSSLTPKQIDKFYFYVVNSNWKQWTKLTKWKCFKRICHFVDKKIDLSEWVIREPKDEPEILTYNEVVDIIRNSPSLEYKLIACLLYESGVRIGELLNLRKKDINFDDDGARIRVDGKTGIRYIRIVNCVELLKVYVRFQKKDKLFNLSEVAVNHMLKKIGRMVGIEKKIYPHLFRHTRATHLAPILTEAEQRVYFGWSRNSKMPSRYTHLSARDVEPKILQNSYKFEELKV